MKTFTSKQSFVKDDNNGILYITGSTGRIVLREDQYNVSFEMVGDDVISTYEIEDDVFEAEVARLASQKIINAGYEAEQERRRKMYYRR